MTDVLTNIIIDELLNPTFLMTRQYLKILEVDYNDNIPKISKIDINEEEKQATVYVGVKNESFFIEFNFEITDEPKISWVNTAPFIRISLIATSEELTLETLISLTTVKPRETISKGDLFSDGKFEYSYNGLVFESYSGPGQFTSKLNLLLDLLETDISGIKELTNKTNSKDLLVTLVYHNGTGSFTGLSLDSKTINRLAKLGLELTFDIYGAGSKFVTD